MLTKEEKAIAINYVRMAYKKGWCKPGEYNIINIIDNYYHQTIYEIKNIIDKEWNKLEKETLAFGGNKNEAQKMG